VLRRTLLRLLNVLRPSRAEPELAREIDAHLALLTADLERHGFSAASAAAEARRRFGSIAHAQDLHRDSRSFVWLDDLRRDVAYTVRVLRRSPSFTIISVLTLAVGIGVNTLVFTVTNSVLFKGFPLVEASDRLVYMTSGIRCCLSYPDFEDWRAQATLFTSMALVHGVPATVTIGAGHPQLTSATEVTANTFRLVGQRPILGRDFVDADMHPGAPAVAVLRYTAWQRWFSGDAAVIGRTIRVNGRPLTVIGVRPRGFSFPQNQDVWVPLVPTPDVRRRDARENWFALGRLSEGVTIARARAEMDTIGRRLAASYPATNDGRNRVPRVYTFEDFFIGAGAAAVYRAMWGAVAFVLLIACANLANLLLARGVARQHEIAVRMAIGAGRRRVIGQLLVESLMLSAMGGIVGWWLARAGVRVYAAVANGSGISEETFGNWFMDVLDYSMDGRAFVYLAVISMVTAVVFGLVPALRLSKFDVGRGLKPGARTMTADPRHRRVSRVLVAAEMALAIVLVAGAGTLLRGFLSVYLASPGFDPSGVTVAQIALPRERKADEAALRLFLDRALELGANAPSIEHIATASALPGWNLPPRAVDVEGVGSDERTRPVTGSVTIGGEYFRTLGVPLVEGRGFVDDKQPARREAIVNRQFATRYLPGAALGRRIRFVHGAVPGPWLLVVGVAPDLAQTRIPNQRDPVVYVSARQQPTPGVWVLARSRSAADRLDEPLRAALPGLDPDLLVAYGPSPLSDRLALNYEYRAVVATVFALFAAIAVLLAAFGLYGVMAFSVAARTQEIGIRAAIGGTVRQILALIAADAMQPVATGLVGGVAASVALGAVLRAELAQVKPSDPTMLAAACAILVVAAGIGCIAPARRALRVDPMIATRQAD
jgi:putative ABC transport system permease protein